MRNPNGFGSVYKLSGKNRRKPYGAKKTIGWDDNGYPISVVLGYYEKRSEAFQALCEFNANPYDLSKKDTTVSEIFEVFKQRRFGKISKSGQGVYNAAFKHISSIHNAAIRDLRTYQMQTLIDNMETKWQSKSHVQTLLTQLFDIAVELDICQKNYASFIKLDGKEKSDLHKPFTADEISVLFDNAEKIPFADTALILIYTGMRPSEMLKLETKNIHLNKRIMQGGLKTKAGKNRLIPISQKIYPFIKKYYSEHNIYLFEENGKAISYKSYMQMWKRLMEQLGMEHLPHDGRHTFATIAARVGADSLTVKRIMGHASSGITEGVYTHKDIQDLIKAIDLL